MNNTTKIEIRRPASEVFEAFVDPEKIGKFWFSSSSQRWAVGGTITLRYDEYQAQGDIVIHEIVPNEKIVFQWGTDGEGHVVTILLRESNHLSTVVEVMEEGFGEQDTNLIPHLLDNKEGWVYMLTCLKGYLEYGVDQLRAALVKE